MKLQNLTVIFIIIIIPIILVLSLYISSGIKTIKYQSLYDDGLLSATHDAVYSYELNSANNDYSENPETKRSIIKSSVKMFEKSLANSCGIPSYSSDEIEEYVPAVVFGMYDGFYMYAPSGLYDATTGKVEDYAHNLKNYVYYSEVIRNASGKDITITYSLDNYITVSGDFGDGYEIKKGYLMKVDDALYSGVKYDNIKIYTEEIDGEINTEATEYYKAAFSFTHWFLNETGLSSIDIDGNGSYPFAISNGNDPENEKSAFVQHKRKVIKDKIESVLNSTITAYSNRTWGKTYKMPKLSQDDWQKIYNNISIITFFQGKKIGLTNYNGYCVVNCTNTKEYVNPNLMYFTDEDGYYHSILCEKCKNYEIIDKSKLNGYKIGSFEKKQISVIPEGETEPQKEYFYEHNELACYDCINGASTSEKENVYEYINASGEEDLKSVYWTSLGRERYDPSKITPIDTIVEVKFDANEGIGQEKLEKYNVKYNYAESIVFPTDADEPTREGYTFNGWSTTKDGRNLVVPDTQKATVDITYYAAWEINKYKVLFDFNNTDDGINTHKKTETWEYNKLIQFPTDYAAPTRDGYRLVGWSYDKVEKGILTPTTDLITEEEKLNERVPANNSKVYYGVWGLKEYQITFDYNFEEKGIIETKTVEHNKWIDFPEYIKNEIEGWNLIGWSENPSDSTGINSAQATKDTTYYAIWKIKEYEITFDYNDGTGEKLVQRLEYNTRIVFPSRTKVGYKLIGWSKDTTASKIVYTTVQNQDIRAKEVITYYAIWEPIKYTVEYDGNGATEGNMTSSTHTYDQSKKLTKNAYKKKGYIFQGWSKVKDGAVDYNDEASVINLANVDGATVTLYAKWKAITYTIEYDGNGETSGVTNSSKHTYDEEKTLTPNGYSKTGYTFIGWAETETGAKKYNDKQTVKNLTDKDGDVITLYAKWEPIKYTIEYNGNGATSGSTPSSEHTYDELKALTQNGFSKTGHTFKGWAKTPGGSKEYSDRQEVKNLSTENGATVTLYAKWERNTYTITYKRNHTNSDTESLNLNPKTAKYEDNVTLPTPTREGYTFKGWNTDRNATTGVNTWKIVDNITLYAIWQVNTYTVVYNGNGSTSGSMQNSIHTYNVERALNKNNFNRTGYSFDGWARTAGGGKEYNDEELVTNLTSENGATVNLYAVWKDNIKPVITSVTKSKEGWTNGNVTITVTATDAGSGVDKYSFDNGTSWQDSNKKEYTANTSNIQIRVKDKDGNISDTVTTRIDNIDKVKPTLTATFDNVNKINISVGDNASGIDYYQVKIGNTNVDKTTISTRYSDTYSPDYSKRSDSKSVQINKSATYTIIVVDLAGNETTNTLVVDKTLAFQNKTVTVRAKGTGSARENGTPVVYLDVTLNMSNQIASNAIRYDIQIIHKNTGQVRASGSLNAATGTATIGLRQETPGGSIFIDYRIRITAYNSLGESLYKDNIAWISTTREPIFGAYAVGLQDSKPGVVNVIVKETDFTY